MSKRPYMMAKPPEITNDEWDALTSPENYYADGEFSPSQADAEFRRRVAFLVKARRDKVSPPPTAQVASGQVWRDENPEMRRTVMVLTVDRTHATVRRVSTAGGVLKTYGRSSRISLDRFKPGPNGFRRIS
ncbi:MAG: hypothetical protein E6R04_06635 [Spirochaetes bacterium]|nr:MAG: hypothetical protein E6R04_06635 [Spirochaetota bacterium]